jgi:hypothetical protein
MREFREYDDMRSSTVTWLNNIKTNGELFSYYIPEDELQELVSQIEAVEFFDQLGIILKK